MSEAAKPLDYAAMLETFEATRRERDRLSKDVRPINKRTLFDLLAAAGITRVVVVFDGYGDSGQIESITPFAGETEATFPADQITLRQVRSDASGTDDQELAVHQAIETLAYDLLEETHPGWENNDGAFGEFVFDVGAQTITLDHNERFTDVETFAHDW